MRTVLFLIITIFTLQAVDASILDWFKQAPSKPAQGYSGDLPDIKKEFEYRKKSSKSQSFTEYVTTLTPEDLKETPRDDDLFVDLILKKSKGSNFVKDVNAILPALNNLKKCLESDQNIQKFNANVNVLDLYVRKLENAYWDQPERFFQAYKYLIYINNRAKTVANFLYEANIYSRYLAYQTEGSMYHRENIQAQKKYLLDEIYQTITIVSQAR